MKLPAACVDLLYFAIRKYGKERLAERLNIIIPDFEALIPSAINKKKECRKKAYYLEDGPFHSKNSKLKKAGKSDMWRFDQGIAILKPLSFMEKIKKLFADGLGFIIKPIKKLIHDIINDVTGDIPKPVIWAFIFAYAIYGVLSKIVNTILTIILVLFTFNPGQILSTILKALLSLVLTVLFQLFIAITAPFYLALFAVTVDIFGNKLWFKRMILGVIRRKYSEETLVAINNQYITKIEHKKIKRFLGGKWHSVVIAEGDTEKHNLFEKIISMIVPEYWRGTSHVFKVKDKDDAASLIAFLQGTYVVE